MEITLVILNSRLTTKPFSWGSKLINLSSPREKTLFKIENSISTVEKR